MVSVFLGGLVGGTLSSTYWMQKFEHQQQPAATAVNQFHKEGLGANVQLGRETESKLTPSDIGRLASPAVVAINTKARVRGIFGSVGTVQGAGSGVLISADGYIVTNNHVIEGSEQITVNLASGASLTAQVVGRDSATDLAVIKVEGQNLPYLEMGDSSNVQLGDQVVAIGNPLGELEGSLTVGYISGTNRTVSVKEDSGRVLTMYGLFQTDAAINQGNSGGALINMEGQLIGINSVKNLAVGVEGLGFAIPTNTVRPIVQDLIEHGEVMDRPTLGIVGIPVRAEMIQEFDYPQGIYIRMVVSGGPAEKAGLKKGDVLTGIDGKKVASMSDVQAIKSGLRAGDSVKIEFVRSGETMETDLTLAAAAEGQNDK